MHLAGHRAEVRIVLRLSGQRVAPWCGAMLGVKVMFVDYLDY